MAEISGVALNSAARRAGGASYFPAPRREDACDDRDAENRFPPDSGCGWAHQYPLLGAHPSIRQTKVLKSNWGCLVRPSRADVGRLAYLRDDNMRPVGSRLGRSNRIREPKTRPPFYHRHTQVPHLAYKVVVDSIASRHAVQPTSLSRAVRLQLEPMCKL